jgi:hypothetical protein
MLDAAVKCKSAPKGLADSVNRVKHTPSPSSKSPAKLTNGFLEFKKEQDPIRGMSASEMHSAYLEDWDDLDDDEREEWSAKARKVNEDKGVKMTRVTEAVKAQFPEFWKMGDCKKYVLIVKKTPTQEEMDAAVARRKKRG